METHLLASGYVKELQRVMRLHPNSKGDEAREDAYDKACHNLKDWQDSARQLGIENSWLYEPLSTQVECVNLVVKFLKPVQGKIPLAEWTFKDILEFRDILDKNPLLKHHDLTENVIIFTKYIRASKKFSVGEAIAMLNLVPTSPILALTPEILNIVFNNYNEEVHNYHMITFNKPSARFRNCLLDYLMAAKSNKSFEFQDLALNKKMSKSYLRTISMLWEFKYLNILQLEDKEIYEIADNLSKIYNQLEASPLLNYLNCLVIDPQGFVNYLNLGLDSDSLKEMTFQFLDEKSNSKKLKEIIATHENALSLNILTINRGE